MSSLYQSLLPRVPVLVLSLHVIDHREKKNNVTTLNQPYRGKVMQIEVGEEENEGVERLWQE